MDSNSQNILNSSNSIPNYFNNRKYCALHIPLSIMPCCASDNSMTEKLYFYMHVVNNKSSFCAVLHNVSCIYGSNWYLEKKLKKKKNYNEIRILKRLTQVVLLLAVQRRLNNPECYTKTYLYCLYKTQPPSYFLSVHQIPC